MGLSGGPKEAARMILEMGAEGKKLLETIKKSDPKMAELIASHLINLEDIQHISASQLVGLLRDLDLETFGVALRSLAPDTINIILAKVSTGIRLDIEDGLKSGLKPVNELEKAQDEVLKLLKEKVDAGHIVIDSEQIIID